MLKKSAYKLLYSFSILWGVASLVFFLLSVLPGDPSRMMMGQRDQENLRLIIQQKYGFDQPLAKQYLFYLNDLSPVSFHSKDINHFTNKDNHSYSTWIEVQLNCIDILIKSPYLRYSFVQKEKLVSSIIIDTIPNTFLLAISAMSLAIILGISLGIIAAVHQNKFIDHFLSTISVFGMALPSFFAAVIVAWLFGYVLHEYTGLSMTGSFYEVDDYGRGQTRVWSNLILPTITLGIRPLAVIMQLTRNSLLDILNEDYIRTAKAKGLSHTRVLFVHALPNALNPIITAASGWLASMLAGAVFIEYIFGWNGIGKEIVSALNFLDLPLVMGSVLTISACFIVITLLTDIIYYIIDPRIRN